MKAFITLTFMILWQVSFCQMTPNYFNVIKKDEFKNQDSDGDGISDEFDINPTQSDSTQVSSGNSETKYDIIGAGAALGGSSQGPGSVLGKGAIGVAFYNEKSRGSIVFNLGSNENITFSDEMRNGTILLIPGNTSKSIQFEYRRLGLKKPKNSIGYHFSGIFGFNDEWVYNNLSFPAGLLSLKGGASAILLNPKEEDTNIMLFVDLGITYRGLISDISVEDEFKLQVFGSKKNNYLGIEIGAELLINDIKIFFYLPYFLGQNVRGLTNGQMVFGSAVSGAMFKDIIK